MRTAGTTGKRVGYGWLYNWYAAGSGILAPYAGDDGLYFEAFLQEWSDQIDYLEGDYVLYNNEVYRAIANVPIGTEPTNTQYWEHIPTEDPNAHQYSDGDYIRDGSELYIFHDWRVPSDADWTELTNYLESFAHIDNTNVGGALKSTRNEWSTTGATNEFGFSGLPGGFRVHNGSFIDFGSFGHWWSATELSTPYAWTRGIAGNEVTRLNEPYNSGLSIRCIQDKAAGESDGDTGTLTDIDGNIYKWVVIGNHRWMAENLRVTHYRNGIQISNVTSQNTWETTTSGARCAYDNDSYFVYPPLK